MSGMVDLFKHDSFVQIPFPLSPPRTAPKAAEDLAIMRTQKIQECSTHCLWLLLLIIEGDRLSWKPECRKSLLAPFPGGSCGLGAPIQAPAELVLRRQLVPDGCGPAHSGPHWVCSFFPQRKLVCSPQSADLGLHHRLQGCTPVSTFLLGDPQTSD